MRRRSPPSSGPGALRPAPSARASAPRAGARLLRLALAATLFAAALAWPAAAGSLAITPVRIALPQNGRPEVVRLTNTGSAPTLIEVKAFLWADESDPGALQPTTELLAAPPLFELAPAATQVIRLALRRPVEPERELTYRILITEVPREVGAQGTGVTFSMQLNVPVFVTPPGAVPEPVWSVRAGPGGGTELVLANDGRAHIQVRDLQLLAASSPEPVFATEGASYVLARQERAWPLGKPLSALPDGLEVRAQTDRGPLVAPVARQGG